MTQNTLYVNSLRAGNSIVDGNVYSLFVGNVDEMFPRYYIHSHTKNLRLQHMVLLVYKDISFSNRMTRYGVNRIIRMRVAPYHVIRLFSSKSSARFSDKKHVYSGENIDVFT